MILRLPPSPTGSLHLGTARTALFNFLCAKKNNGELLFRCEDTDAERSKKEFEKEILDGLKWLGMDFEKISPKIFRQTDNLKIHQKYLKILWEQKKIFPCFSTKEEIAAKRKKAEQNHENFVFWSPYRDEDPAELEKKIQEKNFVWRFKTPQDKEITWTDEIRGKISVSTNTLGDFVIARNNESILYLLANAIDDIEQKITHIVRGEDGLPNTPKQILIFEALDKSIPAYAHIPLVIDENKKKLSKRNVKEGICVLIKDFQKAGFVPEAVVNGLVFLGWNPKSTEEIFSLDELSQIFEIKNINSAASQYDFEKMRWFNYQWGQKLSLSQIINYFEYWVKNFYPEYEKFLDHKNLEKAIDVTRKKAKTFLEFPEEFEYLLKNPGIEIKKLLHEKFSINYDFAKKILTELLDMIEKIPENNFLQHNIFDSAVALIKKLELKNGPVLHPFRVALSNRERSASPFEIAEVLGKEETKNRLKQALEKL